MTEIKIEKFNPDTGVAVPQPETVHLGEQSAEIGVDQETQTLNDPSVAKESSQAEIIVDGSDYTPDTIKKLNLEDEESGTVNANRLLDALGSPEKTAKILSESGLQVDGKEIPPDEIVDALISSAPKE